MVVFADPELHHVPLAHSPAVSADMALVVKFTLVLQLQNNETFFTLDSGDDPTFTLTKKTVLRQKKLTDIQPCPSAGRLVYKIRVRVSGARFVNVPNRDAMSWSPVRAAAP